MVHVSIRVPLVFDGGRNQNAIFAMPEHNSGQKLLSARIYTWRRREKSVVAAELVSSDQWSELAKPDLVGFGA